MEHVKIGDTVHVRYVAMTDDGELVASSGEAMAQLTIGREGTLPAIEDTIVGMTPGTMKIKKTSWQDTFGAYSELLVTELERDFFRGEGVDPVVGMELDVHQSDGRTLKAMVTEVTDDVVKLDANYTFARKPLLLIVELAEPPLPPASD